MDNSHHLLPESENHNHQYSKNTRYFKKTVIILSIFIFISAGLLLPVFSSEKNYVFIPSIIEPGFFPISEDAKKKIEINLMEQKMYLWLDGAVIDEFIISSGKKSTPTRTGSFSVLSKYPVAYGVIDGIVWTMPYFLGIYMAGSTENGIHELPLANGWRESARSLGRPISHGCIRLAIGEAVIVYNWADLGTPVLIHY